MRVFCRRARIAATSSEPTVVGSGTHPPKIHANNRFNYINVATTLQHVLQTKGRRLSRSCAICKFTHYRAPIGPASSSRACANRAGLGARDQACLQHELLQSTLWGRPCLPAWPPPPTMDRRVPSLYIAVTPKIFLPQKSRGVLSRAVQGNFPLACLMVRAMFILVAAAHLAGCRAHGVRAAPASASVAAFWPTP